mmetsp:Transcript_23535/g.41631  ORF Transcript_23535/g.41631 Transcript_23535/m.41631 type:complete len:170 (+) Transcript_23535:190-699(+)
MQNYNDTFTYNFRALDSAVLTAIGPTSDPHMRSACHVAVYEELGIEVDGYDAALLDKDRRRLSKSQKTKVVSAFAKFFSAKQFILEMIQDVNQTTQVKPSSAVRNIDLNKLYRWASEQDQSSFDAFSIFFDESKANEYITKQPKEQRRILPHLSPKIARKILRVLEIVT